MPYPRKLLGQGEEIILDFHPHWSYLIRPVGWTALWLVGLGASLWLLRNTGGFIVKLAAFGAAVVAWIATAGVTFLRWYTTEYVLTSDRLIIRQGIVAKHGREIPLENINDISFSQSVFERLVGAGDLVVESAGEQGQSAYSDIPKPSRVQNEIYRALEDARARMMRGQPFATAPAGAAPRVESIPRQIEELARLRDQGLISEQEFQAKRAELLRRM